MTQKNHKFTAVCGFLFPTARKGVNIETVFSITN